MANATTPSTPSKSSASSKALTKTRKLINHLRSGKTITPTQAENKFGVRNLRAMISTIRARFEAYGNWQIWTGSNSRGETSYSMVDTHPGPRVWGFDANGKRYML